MVSKLATIIKKVLSQAKSGGKLKRRVQKKKRPTRTRGRGMFLPGSTPLPFVKM